MALSESMKKAIELLKKEEYYLCDTYCSCWKAYNLSETIHTRTMDALEKRGIIQIELSLSGNAMKTAKLINPDYEEISKSDYCLHCMNIYQIGGGRYKCSITRNLVIGKDGRATIHAMQCHKY